VRTDGSVEGAGHSGLIANRVVTAPDDGKAPMFVDTLTAPLPARALTPRAIAAITQLPLTQVEQRSDIPSGSGIYVWAADWDSGIWYTGSGTGFQGLRARVGGYLGWVAAAAGRAEDASRDPLDETSLAVTDVPIIRAIVEHSLTCFAASVPETADQSAMEIAEPAGAAQWEKRILMANRTITGNPSVLGGSAWELKGAHWEAADLWSWHRLREMRSAA